MLFVLHQCSDPDSAPTPATTFSHSLYSTERPCLWAHQQTANSQQNSVHQSQTPQRAAEWSYYPFDRQ